MDEARQAVLDAQRDAAKGQLIMSYSRFWSARMAHDKLREAQYRTEVEDCNAMLLSLGHPDAITQPLPPPLED